MLMNWLQDKLCDPEILKVLWEKREDTSLPFEALKDLCDRLNKPLTEEQCIFVCANYFVRIQESDVSINFKEFLLDLTEIVHSEQQAVEKEGDRQ